MTYDLLIIFVDGSRKVVKDVSEYGFLSDRTIAYFIKGEYKRLIPTTQLRFIGRLEDWGEDFV